VSSAAQESQPAVANIAHILRQLAEEADKSRTEGGLVRNSADFAQRLKDVEPPSSKQVADKITRRLDNDAFVDAYIRWQLTSFDPPFEVERLADREFDRLLESLPPLLPNPRADQSLLEALQKASAIGTLTDAQQKEINDRLNALATQASHAAAFNVAATQFRQWLRAKFKPQPHRALTLLLEEAAAIANAGWPAEDAKAEVDRAAERLADMREFSNEQRRAFASVAERSLVKSRMYLIGAGVSENALAVNFGTTGVFDYDIRRWIKAVARDR
jgi:hypothetical protein